MQSKVSESSVTSTCISEGTGPLNRQCELELRKLLLELILSLISSEPIGKFNYPHGPRL